MLYRIVETKSRTKASEEDVEKRKQNEVRARLSRLNRDNTIAVENSGKVGQ